MAEHREKALLDLYVAHHRAARDLEEDTRERIAETLALLEEMWPEAYSIVQERHGREDD